MKKILLLLIALVFIINLHSQEDRTVFITGTVLDATTQEPVEQAGIRILNASDSSYVSGGVTDISGRFRISVPTGRYIVVLSFLGYTDGYVNVNANKSENALGNILLNQDGILLSEATVVAKAPEIVVRGDTVEYNADSYKVQESAVLEDLIKRIPGAEVDSEGKITVNGKEIQKILVDGKEFFSDDPKVASKNLPAKMVDKVQVLDRKSDMAQMTGFDDGDEETVINLTVKPGMKEGTFGNAYAGYGSKDRYEANAMVNYMRNSNQFTVLGGINNTNNAGFSDFASNMFGGMRPRGLNFGGQNGITKSINGGGNFAMEISDKLKYGGNIRYGQTDNDVETHSYTQYAATEKRTDQYEMKNSYGNNKSDNFNVDLRFEWTPDTATTVIFKPNFRYSKNRNWQRTDFITTGASISDSINWGGSQYSSDGNGIRLNGDLEVSRKLNNNGRVISFRVSGGIDNTDTDGKNKSDTYYRLENYADELIDQRFDLNNDSYNWRAFASYVEPIGRNNFLQLTYSFRKNHSTSDRKTYKDDGSLSYSIIDTAYTKKLENNFTNQEIELNFQSVREKFNYTVGIGIQPSSSESHTTYQGKISTVKNKVTNFSPNARFNYIWDKRTNLRIDYRGITSQPTATQLSDVIDLSNPLNLTQGNPDLKPSFENRLNIRYRKFNPEQASAFMIFGRFSYTLDDITTYSITDTTLVYQNDTIELMQGKRLTRYTNVDGNINASVRVIYNTPLRNKKFSVNSMTFLSYNHNKGYIDSRKNTQNTYRFQESLGLEYRSDIFDAGIRGNFTYNNIRNSLGSQRSDETYDYGGNVNATVYLPYDFTIETDLNYSTNSGYSAGFKRNEWLWNASIAKQLFKAKNGTIRFKIYDILHERSNISRQSTNEYIQDITTNTLTSYFMFHFVYRFQLFKGGAKQSNMQRGRGPGMGPPHGGGPPRI